MTRGAGEIWQFVEKRLVTPETAGVQKSRFMRINALLDAGLRRHDEIRAAAVISTNC
jgi:hypothetical protein